MKTIGRLSVLILGLLIISLASCKNISIPGNVAGQLLSEGGQGQGFLAVELFDTKTNSTYETVNTNDVGNYIFKKVPPGTYILKVIPIGGGELPTDCEEFNLAPGKTVTKNVVVYRPNKKNQG